MVFLSQGSIKRLFGDTLEGVRDLEASNILKEAQESWNVYHINLQDYMGRRPSVQEGWGNYLGDRMINTEDETGKDIPEIIAGIIIGAYQPPKEEENKETTNHLR